MKINIILPLMILLLLSGCSSPDEQALSEAESTTKDRQPLAEIWNGGIGEELSGAEEDTPEEAEGPAVSSSPIKYTEGDALDTPWYDAYRAIVTDWSLVEDPDWAWEFDFLRFYFKQDYQFDSYWLCDIDKNGTPELILYSDTGNMTDMVAAVTYTDRAEVVFVDMIHGINLETEEFIVHGYWHGAGGSWEYEWTGYRLQGNMTECSMGIDFHDLGPNNQEESHYWIYDPETGGYGYTTDSQEFEELYAAHVANCIPVDDIPKYKLVDLSGLKVIYQ